MFIFALYHSVNLEEKQFLHYYIVENCFIVFSTKYIVKEIFNHSFLNFIYHVRIENLAPTLTPECEITK